jgi:hypothetical protein
VPPTRVHFNGSVNLADAETVMREITSRVPEGVSRIPDGETGERGNWIMFQLAKFQQVPGLEMAPPEDRAPGYEQMPRLRLAPGVEPTGVEWPNLGYADAYQESFAIFDKLQAEGTIPAAVRFQADYPTPLASINAYLEVQDQPELEPSYERATFADLDHLLDAVPHDRIAIQWDVAVEFGVLEGGFGRLGIDDIVERLARCIDHVPTDVRVGLHLCYGDYQHHHFKEPESLAMQVDVANRLTAGAGRPVDFLAFTVPQYQREADYFEPLASLDVSPATELYFALVPYHPENQAEGTTEEQVRLIDSHLGDRPWGICTECGMGRAERDEIPILLDLHREIIATYA